MAEPKTSGRPSRRTVAKGAAWAVPAIAVAVPATAAAASGEPPPPVIDFGGACGNTGSTGKGCGGFKSLQVPLTLSNPTPADIVFQITSMYTCNCDVAPVASGPGVFVGIHGIWETADHTIPRQDDCNDPTESACTGGITGDGTSGSIVVPAGTINATYWIESVDTQESSKFSTTISWRLLDAATCALIFDGTAQTASAIEPLNCDGSTT